jgi:hypothetical protein
MPDVLEAHLKCKTKAYLKLAGERGQPHDYGRMLARSRERVRAAQVDARSTTPRRSPRTTSAC